MTRPQSPCNLLECQSVTAKWLAAGRGSLPALLLALAAVAVSVPTITLFAPITDEGAVLTGAARLIHGGSFFRDVDAYPLPGAWYLLAGVMRLFGESVVVARTFEVAIFALAVVLAYLAARRVMSGPAAISLGIALLAAKYWAWPMWTMYFYSDVAIVLSLGGMLALVHFLEGGSGRAAMAAGVLFGLAAFCKQTVGLYPGAAVACFLAVRAAVGRKAGGGGDGASPAGRACWLYMIGLAAALLAPLAAFAGQGLGDEYLFNALLRPLVGYAPLSGLPYTPMLRVWELGTMPGMEALAYEPAMAWNVLCHHALRTGVWPPAAGLVVEALARIAYLAMPLAFVGVGLLLLAAWRRHTWAAGNMTAFGWWLAAGATVLSVFPRASYAHLMNLAPVWLPVAFLAGHLAAGRLARLRAALGVAMAAGALALLAGGIWQVTAVSAYAQRVVDLPRVGRLRVDPLDDRMWLIIRYVQSHTAPGEPIFVYGQEAYYYFVCDRYSPWRFAQVYPGMTGRGEGGEVAAALERRRVRYVIRGNVGPALGLPAVRSYAPVLDDYIASHYRELAPPLGGNGLAAMQRID